MRKDIARERTAERLRLAKHLLELATSTGPVRELRLSGAEDEILRRQRGAWDEVTTAMWRGHLKAAMYRALRQGSRRNAAAIRVGRVTLINDQCTGRSASGRSRRPLRRHPRRQPPRVLARTCRTAHPATPTTRTRRAHCHRIPAPLPRRHGAMSRKAADEIEDLLRSVGFTQMSTETLPLSPPVACVLAASPGLDGSHIP